MSGSVSRLWTAAVVFMAVADGALRCDREGYCVEVAGDLDSTATPVKWGCHSCSPGWRGPCCSRASWSPAPESC